MSNSLACFYFQQGLCQLRGLHINPFSDVHWEVKIMIKYGFIFLAIPLVVVGMEQSELTVLSFHRLFP